MQKAIAAAGVVALLAVASPGQAALIDRGNGLIYDDVLDVTWVQDANLAGQAFTWQEAMDWADSLAFGGFDDWRLPSMDVNGDGTVVACSAASEVECRDTEYGYMFYYNLGGSFGDDLRGNQGPFTDIQLGYWSSTDEGADAWIFIFAPGGSVLDSKDFDLAPVTAWAVRNGDVAAVPEPVSLALLGVGLLGVGVARRRAMARH